MGLKTAIEFFFFNEVTRGVMRSSFSSFSETAILIHSEKKIKDKFMSEIKTSQGKIDSSEI